MLGRYLQDCRAGYILCEDTFGSTLGPDQHLVTDQRAAADFAAKQRGKGYLYWGDSTWCVRIESEDAARCTLFPAARMVTDSKAILLESLTDAEKALVRRIFLTQPLPEKACCPNTKSSAHSCTTDYNANIIVSHNHVSF